ncbi:ABC transporter ATP-binding protein [Candidatus Protochlamydia sp. R18]|uniref:ABC transporter ATP-binding protein n=1 Tax=Candidatus Protochlamydia sp. R18 TaxID=1353977 RepID=UPI00069324C0|nr:ABC transporter ATP-binding protein [Candidatus Protochlamydia sp. R18]
MIQPLVDVCQLFLTLETLHGSLHALRGVNFQLYSNEIVGLLGESGCGKSLTASSILKIFPPSLQKVSGQILFQGSDILKYSDKQIEMVRGKKIGMIFQDPSLALNPTKTIADQFIEGLLWHCQLNKQEAYYQGINWLNKVGINNAALRMKQYPHEISGGMKQRVIIAMTLACHPSLVIADEPTTALDVTTQRQVLNLLKELQKEVGMTILLITHDLGVADHICDRLLIMYAGQIVESGSAKKVIQSPKHPYTQGLIQAKKSLMHFQDEVLFTLPGSPPSLFAQTSLCAFGPRCRHAMRICQKEAPPMNENDHHKAACWLKVKEKNSDA